MAKTVPSCADDSRAIDLAEPDEAAPDTAFANGRRIAGLLLDKAYKQGCIRIHHKGVRTADGGTSGLLLNGALPSGAGDSRPPVAFELPGATRAAVIEDLARSEAYAALLSKFGDKVRMKATVYLVESGPQAGTVKASRHKLYFQGADGAWEKKFDHLQDGARGPINRSEVLALQRRVAALSPFSPTIASSKDG